jgi:hypothetical protein
VLNLGSELRVNRQGGQLLLGSFSNLDLGAGDEILIDTYTLTFRLPTFIGITRASASIAASLLFQDTVLFPDAANIAVLTLHNTGKVFPCQFQVRLNGLPGDCFRIDPVPLLHANAQEQIRISLFHRTTYPTAGFHELKLSVSAPKAYPGEEVLIRQKIYVKPFFEPAIALQDDFPARAVVLDGPKPVEDLPQPPASPTPRETPLEPEPPPVPVADVSKPRFVERVLKLEQNAPDDYWNEASVS